jgi:hypothetical protein
MQYLEKSKKQNTDAVHVQRFHSYSDNNLPCLVRDDCENIKPVPHHGVDCEEIHCVDELILCLKEFLRC